MVQPPETAADFYKVNMRRMITKFVFLLILASFLFAGTYEYLTDIFSADGPDTTRSLSSSLSYSVSHQEWYRATRNDTLLSRYSFRDQQLMFNYEFEHFTLLSSWTRSIPNIDDMFNTDNSTLSIKPVAYKFDLGLDTGIKNWRIKPGISYSFSSIADTLFITEYPRSDQSAMNDYFFDLLPETFGDSIQFNYGHHMFKGDLLAQHEKFAFYFSYRYLNNKITESHENTSSYLSLAGPRESLLSLTSSSIRIKLAYSIHPGHLIWGGIDHSSNLFDWQHTLFPGDPVPSEIIHLGSGNNTAFQTQVGYKVKINDFNISTTIASGNISMADTASTPVLGYFMSFFPISHQAELLLNTAYISAKFHADKIWSINRSQITPTFDLMAFRSWSDIDFEALLQFGLEDIEVKETYIHATYLIALGCQAHIFLNSDLFLDLDVEQLIPFIETLSPEPPPPPPPDGTKPYGGLSVKVGVSMTW